MSPADAPFGIASSWYLSPDASEGQPSSIASVVLMLWAVLFLSLWLSCRLGVLYFGAEGEEGLPVWEALLDVQPEPEHSWHYLWVEAGLERAPATSKSRGQARLGGRQSLDGAQCFSV